MQLQGDGSLIVHLQYIPAEQIDVSDEFSLPVIVEDVPTPALLFLFKALDQLKAVDGELVCDVDGQIA